ncbi:MAG: hypothetical protein IJ459_06495 [Clostridia bacterium]|nr:hypothetical protein [Clostridia bacterium]
MMTAIKRPIGKEPNIAIDKTKSRLLFWVMMVGFMGLIYVRNIMKIEYPIVVLLLYVGAMALLCDHDEIVALAVSFVPFSAAFQYRYALLVLIVIYAIKHLGDLKKINITALVPLLLMMVWELLHGIVGEFSFISFFQGFTELIFCSFLISMPNKKFDFPFISRVLAICVAFACTVLLLKLLPDVGYSFVKIFEGGDYRFGINDENAESYVMNYNSNSLGFMCNMSISGLLIRMKSRKANVLDIALIAVLVFYGTLTLSRSFVLCFALIAVLFMLASSVNVGRLLKNVVLMTFAVALMLFILQLTVPYVLENIVSRFMEDDVTGGRAGLMVWYNDYLFSDPEHFVFGTGLQHILSKVNHGAQIQADGVPHNAVQELLVVWGLPGLLLFGFFVFNLILNARKHNKIKLANLIPIIVWFVMGMSGQWITSGKDMLLQTWLYITLINKDA